MNDIQVIDYQKKMNDLLNISVDDVCLLTVDMQNEYLNQEHGTSPLAKNDIDNIIKNTNEVLDKVRQHNIPVIHKL